MRRKRERCEGRIEDREKKRKEEVEREKEGRENEGGGELGG